MNKKICILGAGLTGLTTGWKLSEAGYSVEIIEKKSKVGGISSTFKRDDFYLDYGPHKIYTQIETVLSEIKYLIGEDLLVNPKKSSIRLMDRYFDYPVKIGNLLFGINPLIGSKLGISYIKGAIVNSFSRREDVSYEGYLANRFGWAVYNLVFRPYAKKVWGDPKELSATLAKRRVAIPSLGDLVRRLIFGDKNKPEVSAREFFYPKQGIINLSKKMVDKIAIQNGILRLNSRPISLQLNGNRVESLLYIDGAGEKRVNPDYVVSTIPLQTVIQLITPNPPSEVIKAAHMLKYRSIVLLFLVLNKSRLMQNAWIFFPEEKFIFNRISEQKAFSEYMIPENKTVLCVEITCDYNDELWRANDENIFKKAIVDLEKTNLLKKEDVTLFFTKRIKEAYPLYEIGFEEKLDIVLSYLDKIENFVTTGRQGLFNYNNMDHCIDMGIITAENIIKGVKSWKDIRKNFSGYKIVD